ncbi:hypothetical protein BDZ94DRAFT_1243844 [Collybia nuda]|uniref:Uncharacterized protein n=1 Tax=Collybia nuda TaxID=64659 RepID=A0A9P5YIB8_9AGAR|nr:hypothetical protein BDZ94DRAFT_1243844 [Collybia nuda]
MLTKAAPNVALKESNWCLYRWRFITWCSSMLHRFIYTIDGLPNVRMVPFDPNGFRHCRIRCKGAGASAIFRRSPNLPYQFQQETMALQIKYHRSRHQQQRALIDRMKRDITEVRKYIFPQPRLSNRTISLVVWQGK